MDKVFDITIDESIVVTIDSRYKLKGFIEFIRLSFNKLEIKDNEYTIYFDKENLKKHKLLLQTVVNMHKKVYKSDAIVKRVALNYRKNVVIRIKKHALFFADSLSIHIIKNSSKEFTIRFSQYNRSVYNYVKGLFLFDILELGKEYMIVSFNEDTKNIVFQTTEKNSIMGYKIRFVLDENDFKFSQRKYSIEGSLKEYLVKVRNALELFGVETIYQFPAIKKEYKRLAKKYHPDIHSDKPELIKKIYNKKFMKVKESYELLEDYSKSKIEHS